MSRRRKPAAEPDKDMVRYLVTSHGHLPGVRLSKPGQWGNIPYPDEEAAHDAAKADARGKRFKMERRTYPALPTCIAPEPFKG